MRTVKNILFTQLIYKLRLSYSSFEFYDQKQDSYNRKKQPVNFVVVEDENLIIPRIRIGKQYHKDQSR